MKKLSEELAELDLVFRKETDTEADRERFDELMTLLDSAPEMFSALLECEILLENYPTVKRQVKQAIAKAEGREV